MSQPSMTSDGKPVMTSDGKWIFGSPGDPCCCGGCMLSCDAETVDSTYAVAFAGGVDFDYPNSDHGGTCGGAAAPGGDPTPAAWDYTFNAGAPEAPCTTGWYSTWVDESTYIAVKSILGSGLRIWAVCYYDSNECVWWLSVNFYVCVGASWWLATVLYQKTAGNTPAGTYLVAGTSWLNTSLLTYPTSITLS